MECTDLSGLAQLPKGTTACSGILGACWIFHPPGGRCTLRQWTSLFVVPPSHPHQGGQIPRLRKGMVRAAETRDTVEEACMFSGYTFPLSRELR